MASPSRGGINGSATISSKFTLIVSDLHGDRHKIVVALQEGTVEACERDTCCRHGMDYNHYEAIVFLAQTEPSLLPPATLDLLKKFMLSVGCNWEQSNDEPDPDASILDVVRRQLSQERGVLLPSEQHRNDASQSGDRVLESKPESESSSPLSGTKSTMNGNPKSRTTPESFK